MLVTPFTFLLSLLASTRAVPVTLQSRSETPLSAAELSGLAPYTQFARAAYCPTSKLTGWNCGEACSALAGFQPTLVGGDGNLVQIFFVGFYPAKNTVVVAHEGTDPTKFLSLLTDANIFMGSLSPSLFPGISSNAQVHEGFRDAHAKTASSVLAEVKKLMAAHNTNSVTLVGHSLGGAIAELDALFLTLNIPGASIKAVTYGTPRVGNPDFAELIDSKVPDFSRINNEKDVIPIVPGRFLGFAHPEGEIHITSPGHAIHCSGNDDADDPDCTISTVPNIFVGNILDHLGPYEGINIGTIFCT
ncbi:hypothetical protein AMATHDRAFT_142271 [Amanita thiersii Skay4041]|uniref:Fungal lipase-type domain-containing protein n=1 Tax=Amanita thiersii Skay4041 TaxID=703135 RepID=A0A2A9NN88_9AGAR|nr:hypothetical protein AMATHDRAFT_142271 [Amanita thiersii Skay4041]